MIELVGDPRGLEGVALYCQSHTEKLEVSENTNLWLYLAPISGTEALKTSNESWYWVLRGSS